MKLQEKIDEGLKKVISDWGSDDETSTRAFKTGFRAGFRRGYTLACDELVKVFRASGLYP